MSLRRILAGAYIKLFDPKPKKVQVQLLGRTLTVYSGTITKADKDDAWFYALSKNSTAIFDVGCNVGAASILASIDNPQRPMVLVDPNPKALTMASENLNNNRFGEGKRYVTAFVSDHHGEQVKFYTVGSGAAGSMFGTHAETAKKLGSHYQVETTTLDRGVDEAGYTPDLLKIDVEGAESMALKGATKVAALQKAKFLVEMHGPKEMPMLKNAALVLDWCRQNNYRAWYLSKHVELTDAEQLADRGRCHLLLLPAREAYPEYLRTIPEGAAVQ